MKPRFKGHTDKQEAGNGFVSHLNLPGSFDPVLFQQLPERTLLRVKLTLA